LRDDPVAVVDASPPEALERSVMVARGPEPRFPPRSGDVFRLELLVCRVDGGSFVVELSFVPRLVPRLVWRGLRCLLFWLVASLAWPAGAGAASA
jgi:hypothetical protein